MGNENTTPATGLRLEDEAPVVIVLEDEAVLREMFEVATMLVGPLTVCGTVSEVQAKVVDALIVGSRRFVILSDVEVFPEGDGDRGQALSDGLCSSFLSREAFSGAAVAVEVIRMTGNVDLQEQYRDKAGVGFIAKPFTLTELGNLLGEKRLSVLTGAQSAFWN